MENVNQVKQVIVDKLATEYALSWTWNLTLPVGQFPELGDHRGGLYFKIKGHFFIGQVFIVLMPNETYSVHFGRVNENKAVIEKTITDVPIDSLIVLIHSYVYGPYFIKVKPFPLNSEIEEPFTKVKRYFE